jgi:nucleotide-binding universal stress UspA family protein
MDVKTILWPTDLSKASLKAAPHVVRLAETFKAKVVVLYVGVDLCAYFPAYGNYPSTDTVSEFQNWELKQARDKLAGICAGELKGCPMLITRIVTGDAPAEILKAAASEKADMLVMTRRGTGPRPRPAGVRQRGRQGPGESPIPSIFVG